MSKAVTKNPLNIIVIVAALGYFVDIYDLILFSIVRVPSLKDLGVSGDDLKSIGLSLLNTQMLGMMAGGIIWGILGDKKGRLSVLFGTILLYSVANIANGFVTTINQYYILRFIAGLGLAGELGVGITLVSEVMTKESRGYGTTIVSAIGIAGAVAGFFVADLFSWRVAYYVGGALGLALLVLRVTVYESGMFAKLKESPVKKGSFQSLFTDGKRFAKYIKCIVIGIPVWYIIGILITLAPEFSKPDAINVLGEISGGKAVMFHYTGAAIGAFLTGLLSQYLKSRRRALLIALISLSATLICFFTMRNISAGMFYFILFIIGLPNGYWSVFIATASEQFGTNLRATVTTTVPNFVRGTTVLVTNAFSFLTHSAAMNIITAAALVGCVVIGFAIYSILTMEESFHKDLDYIEVI
jgi:MFS family permease